MRRCWIALLGGLLVIACVGSALSPESSLQTAEREAVKALLERYFDAIVQTDIDTMRSLEENPLPVESYWWFERQWLLDYRVLDVRLPRQDERSGWGLPESGVYVAWVARKVTPDQWPPEWDLASCLVVRTREVWRVRDCMIRCPYVPQEPGDPPCRE